MNTYTEQLPTCTHHVRQSLWLLVFHIVETLVVVASIMLLSIVLLFNESFALPISFSVSSTTMLVILLSEGGVLFIVQSVVLLQIFLHWATDEYYISGHQLIVYRGIIRLDERIFELGQVQSVKLYQSLIGKICKFGNITLHFGSRGFTEIITLKGLHDPKKYERVFREFIPQLDMKQHLVSA